LRIYPLGSGSDYTPFLQHLGIASANIGFGGEGAGGSYHTLYDTFEHYTTWRDPGLVYGVALAQVAGRATLRLANAPRLPFEFTGLVNNIEMYIEELVKLADDMRSATELTHKQLDDGTYAAALDPTKTLGPPKREAAVPHFNFAPLHNAVARLGAAAENYVASTSNTQQTSAKLNKLLYTTEALLSHKDGLIGRPWYKHHLYAPGFYTGYGVKTIPGVREAIEQRNFEQVEGQVTKIATLLNQLAERLDVIVKLAANSNT
jgi:N-acetylated-alpha-linked acidic dipeptidase